MTDEKWTRENLPPHDGPRPRSRMVRVTAERAARVRRITAMINEGLSIAEIAEAEGVQSSAITRLLRTVGVVSPGIVAGSFTLMVRARRISLPSLDRLAARWRCTRAEAAGRIMTACLRRDGALAEHVIRESKRMSRKNSASARKPPGAS
jgi:hypothetical protein